MSGFNDDFAFANFYDARQTKFLRVFIPCIEHVQFFGGWLFEIKLDGFRALAVKCGAFVRLRHIEITHAMSRQPAVFVLWDVIGTLPLPLGVAGHEGSTVIVGLNGLRLLRRSAWTGAVHRHGR